MALLVAYRQDDPPYTLGVLSGADYNLYNGPDFFGYTVEDPWILVRYTLYGDSNLDGVVDDLDHYLVASAYQRLHDSTRITTRLSTG